MLTTYILVLCLLQQDAIDKEEASLLFPAHFLPFKTYKIKTWDKILAPIHNTRAMEHFFYVYLTAVTYKIQEQKTNQFLF